MLCVLYITYILVGYDYRYYCNVHIVYMYATYYATSDGSTQMDIDHTYTVFQGTILHVYMYIPYLHIYAQYYYVHNYVYVRVYT